MKRLTLYYPIKPWFVAQGFGQNLVPLYKELGMKGHNGLDLPGPDGRPIYASHDGQVVFAGEDGSAGSGVVIRTIEPYSYADGMSYFKTIYWHLKPNIPIKAGTLVKAGDLIGYCDTTGTATGPHLHFGLKPVYQGEREWDWANTEQNNGYHGAIDPIPYLTGGYYAQDLPLVLGIMRALVEALKKLISILKI